MSSDGANWPETRWSMIGRTRGEDGAESDESAWRTLIDTYRAPIEKVLRRYLAGRPDGDEAVAAFFGYLYEHGLLERSDPGEGRFRAYIQAVARRYAQGWKGSAARTLPLEVAGPLAESAEPDGRAWWPTLLDLALDRMRPKDADLVRRFHGLGRVRRSSAEELARELGIRRGAVYKRVHGARLRLKDELGHLLRRLSTDDAAWNLEMGWVEDRLASELPESELD